MPIELNPERLPSDLEAAAAGRYARGKKGKKSPKSKNDVDALLGAGVFIPHDGDDTQ